MLGTLILVFALVSDFAYCTKSVFSSKELFIGCLTIFGVRIIAPIISILKGLCSNVCNKEKNNLRALDYLEDVNDDGESAKSKQASHTRYGCLLYSTLPLSYFTGSYRLIDSKNFPSQKGTGIILDFFFYALPMLFIQAINNSSLYQAEYKSSGILIELNNVQFFSMSSKLLLIADLILETIMFVYEIIKLH